jgi:hypothetical protein
MFLGDFLISVYGIPLLAFLEAQLSGRFSFSTMAHLNTPIFLKCKMCLTWALHAVCIGHKNARLFSWSQLNSHAFERPPHLDGPFRKGCL